MADEPNDYLLSFETDNNGQLFIHGNKNGFAELVRIIELLKDDPKKMAWHEHLFVETEDLTAELAVFDFGLKFDFIRVAPELNLDPVVLFVLDIDNPAWC